MPNKNATGPLGQGPRTGRGLGNCEPKEGTNINFGKRDGTGVKAGRGAGRRGNAVGRKLDGTGPQGEGPKTGRGEGNC